MGIKENLDNIWQSINSINPEVSLIAVTKKADIEQTKEAIRCGVNKIGENRVQQALEKFPHLPPVEKHMIGHLQTNKVKHVVKNFDVIQSLDSLKLAKEINKRTDKIIPVMIEVNYEDQKFGIPTTEVEHFYDQVLKFTNLKVIGLMTVAPYVEPEETRPYFATMKKMNDSLKLPELSMGMTNDYKVAIEEGSTMVRIGTAIFS